MLIILLNKNWSKLPCACTWLLHSYLVLPVEFTGNTIHIRMDLLFYVCLLSKCDLLHNVMEFPIFANDTYPQWLRTFLPIQLKMWMKVLRSTQWRILNYKTYIFKWIPLTYLGIINFPDWIVILRKNFRRSFYLSKWICSLSAS